MKRWKRKREKAIEGRIGKTFIKKMEEKEDQERRR